MCLAGSYEALKANLHQPHAILTNVTNNDTLMRWTHLPTIQRCQGCVQQSKDGHSEGQYRGVLELQHV